MENFFIEDQFCHDLDDLIRICDLENDNDVPELEDDWSMKIELSELKPIFQITDYRLTEMFYDANDDKYPEDDSCDIEIRKAINECFDLEKFNSKIPKLYYPSGSFETITKKDLLEYIA